MSRQDKATTERHARTLRELVKRPENKLCADCKRNDPRWASWNLGVFLCIRCSGIHRGMGTHISKVKSVDLDVWTPEQMQSIQNWGNHRANLYWEAHLKPGHVPPEHKMESFIRSKYESRRWALEGPPPADPSVLESSAGAAPPVPTASPPPAAAPVPARATHTPTTSISRTTAPTARQPQPHQLLSANLVSDRAPAAAPAAPAPAPAPAAPAPQNDLFTLDFHAPAQPASAPPKKDVKQDILSLFSSPPASAVPASAGGAFSQAASPWGQPTVPAAPLSAAPTSMIGTGGPGAWGASSGWSAPAPAPPAQGNLWGAPAAPAAQGNLWGAPATAQQANALASSNDVWGAPAGGADLFSAPFAAAPAAKKDDVFGDLWGGFK